MNFRPARPSSRLLTISCRSYLWRRPWIVNTFPWIVNTFPWIVNVCLHHCIFWSHFILLSLLKLCVKVIWKYLNALWTTLVEEGTQGILFTWKRQKLSLIISQHQLFTIDKCNIWLFCERQTTNYRNQKICNYSMI